MVDWDGPIRTLNCLGEIRKAAASWNAEDRDHGGWKVTAKLRDAQSASWYLNPNGEVVEEFPYTSLHPYSNCSFDIAGANDARVGVHLTRIQLSQGLWSINITFLDTPLIPIGDEIARNQYYEDYRVEISPSAKYQGYGAMSPQITLTQQEESPGATYELRIGDALIPPGPMFVWIHAKGRWVVNLTPVPE